jgi:hypothetical protein
MMKMSASMCALIVLELNKRIAACISDKRGHCIMKVECSRTSASDTNLANSNYSLNCELQVRD